MYAEVLALSTFAFLIILYSRDVTGTIMHDYCRYKFHFYPLSWMDAQNVCENENRALVKLDNISEYELISSMAVSTVAPMVSAKYPLATDLWVGLRGQSVGGAMQHQWEDCDHLEPLNSHPWQNPADASSEGCVAYDTNQKKYIVHDCNAVSKPFICEASTPVSCFERIDGHGGDPVYSQFATQDILIKADINGCMDVCTQPCVLFQFTENSNCNRFIYSAGTSATLYARDPAYTNAIVDHTSYPALSVTAPPPQSSCSNFLSPSPSSTPVSSNPIIPSGSACYCPCSQYSNKTYTPEEVQSKIEQIKKELTINVKETNTYQRSLISAPDERVSAQNIGYVGVAILAVVCGLLILIDLPRCVVGVKEFTKKCR